MEPAAGTSAPSGRTPVTTVLGALALGRQSACEKSMTATTSPERANPDLVEDPYPWYAHMREQRRVAYTQPEMPYARMFRLSQHADVQAVLRDPRFGLDGV